MRILITGGTGLIGSALIDALLLDGHKISVLTRNLGKAMSNLPSDVFAAEWDGTSPHGWGEILEESEAVIHLAGESIAGESISAILTHRWTLKNKESIVNSRRNSGRALVEAIQISKNKPQVFIQASAVGYYGSRGVEVIPESTSAGGGFLSKVCQSWEASTADIEKMGVRRIILRTGLVLSPIGGILPIMLLPFRLFVGGPIGKGDQYIPWIHVQDQVNAIRFFLKTDSAQGPYNLSSPNPVTNAEFGCITGGILHRPNRIPTPEFAIKLALGEKATLVLDGQRAIPQRLLNGGYEFKFETLESALRDLFKN